MTNLHVLSAGAAKGLVLGVQTEFERDTGLVLQGSFGAVGAMQERLSAAAPCDVIVLTRAMIDTLAAAGKVEARAITDLGWVHTGVAVPSGAAVRSVGDVPALLTVLAAARSIYLPDPERATAGIHALRVLKVLGLADIDTRLRAFPNGAAAMAAMAKEADAAAVGITQVSEILYTPGVTLLGALPPPHGLATLYTAAIVHGAVQGAAAARLLALLGAPERARWRRQAGFEATA